MGQLRDIEGRLASAGYRLVAVSPDRPEKLVETRNKHGMKFMLLSDSAMEVATAFGVAYSVDDKTMSALLGFGFDIEEASGQKHHLLPVPAVFIASTEARIAFSYVHPDYKVRLDPEVLLAVAEALRRARA